MRLGSPLQPVTRAGDEFAELRKGQVLVHATDSGSLHVAPGGIKFNDVFGYIYTSGTTGLPKARHGPSKGRLLRAFPGSQDAPLAHVQPQRSLWHSWPGSRDSLRAWPCSNSFFWKTILGILNKGLLGFVQGLLTMAHISSGFCCCRRQALHVLTPLPQRGRGFGHNVLPRAGR